MSREVAVRSDEDRKDAGRWTGLARFALRAHLLEAGEDVVGEHTLAGTPLRLAKLQRYLEQHEDAN
jgi:hypothetical protein